MNILWYFHTPFPSREGFSAYRFPGLAAHAPFFIALSTMGAFLCAGGPPLVRPLVLVWILAGLFLGRDFAIFCHYAPLLVLLIWAAMYAAFANAHRLAIFGQQHPVLAALLTSMVLIVQVWMAWCSTRNAG
jgi:hypothetical protein